MAEILKITATVKAILEREPQTRNSDLELYYEVLRAMDFDTDLNSLLVLKEQILAGKLPKEDSVTRIGRMIKKEFPNLVGTNKKLNKEKQKKVKKDLKEFHAQQQEKKQPDMFAGEQTK